MYIKGHKGDQEQKGSILVRTRDACRGPRSKVEAGGGAVAILVELLSIHPALPKNAPLSSFRTRQGVRVWRYTQALAALRQIVARDGGNTQEIGLHSLRIGAATALAAGGVVPDRIIQREGRWRSVVFKTYTRRICKTQSWSPVNWHSGSRRCGRWLVSPSEAVVGNRDLAF